MSERERERERERELECVIGGGMTGGEYRIVIFSLMFSAFNILSVSIRSS